MPNPISRAAKLVFKDFQQFWQPGTFFSMRVKNTALDSASDGAAKVKMENCKKTKNVEEGRFSATNVSGLALAGLELGHIRLAATRRVLCTQLLMQRAERAAIRRSSIFHMRSIHNIQTA